MGPKTATALSAALLMGTVVHGISKGIGSQDVSSAAYELLTGDPQIDDYTFGTNAGITDMLFPTPLPTTQKAFWHGAKGMRSGLPRFLAGVESGFVNSTSMGDYNRQNNSPLAPVYVDGSMVFGMHNGRMG